MAKVMLKLRDLRSGEPTLKELDGVADAIDWLAERPAMTEVLGLVFEGITREDNDRMKAAMRPLDDGEKARVKELDEKEDAEREKRAEARRVEDEKKAGEARAAAKGADPNRQMEIRYRFDKTDLEKTDLHDEREITADAKKAVLEWVYERMEWVASRGQTVGEAKVTVYPADVPPKKDRVIAGTFIPVTAPPKGAN